MTKSLFAALLLASSVVAAEEQYPAADFQPTVIYSDSADAGASKESATAASASEENAATSSEKSAEKSSSQTYLLGLAVLAIAGGFFLSQKPKKCKAKQSTSDAVYASDTNSGLTGVERYLQEKNKTAPTGVARYLAKKEASEKEAAVTGVEKYLRNRG